MYSGNYNRIKHMNGMAIYTSKLGNQRVIDTTPPHAMSEFEYTYREHKRLHPEDFEIDTEQEHEE